MQTDEEVGKVAQAVPVIISRTLELFVESLLTKTLRITNARNAKTLSPSHMKQCIISESRFDFLRDLVKNIPDIGVNEEQLSGSEAGYGNEAGTSPASTSTSSSSNGGGGAGHTNVSESSAAASGLFQRSESYTPSTSYAGALPIAQQLQIPTQHQQQQNQAQPISLKQPISHANSLNFYKEISLEDSSSSTSSCREPPPKLTRLHSAPAASATTTNSIPIKIDILPNLSSATAPLLAALSSSNNSQQTTQVKSNNGAGVANSNSFKITYKLGPNSNPPTPTAIEKPVIKLDYSNIKIPLASAEQSKQPSSSTQTSASSSSNQRHLQPTIKIDLSNISTFNVSPAQVQTAPLALIAKNQQQVPSTPTTASTPSTPLSGLSLVSSSSSSPGSSLCSGASSKNPYVFQQQLAAAGSASTSSSGSAAPLYSSVSSTIPGMDEDYDDI